MVENFNSEKSTKENEKNQCLKQVEDNFSPSKRNNKYIRFPVTFAGKCTNTIFADIETDVNLIGSVSIQIMQAFRTGFHAEHLAKLEIYSLAADKGEKCEALKIVSDAPAYCNVELHVRNGCMLMIQNDL